MRILIADDHAVLREGLRQILAEAFPMAEFGGAGTTTETIECLGRGRWDILVLDVFMPGRNGLDVLHEVRKNHPKLPVLVLSSAPEEQLGLRVLKAGASGYLNKQTAPQKLVRAVTSLLAGGKFVTATLVEKLVAGAGAADLLPHETLSDREFQLMQLVLAGRSLKEVAAELSLSVKTIRTFHARLLKKLALKNDVELVHYALEHRLVESALPPRSPDH